MMKRLMNRKAFTLIELAVVMVIIGILVAVLVPTFGMRDKANIAKAKGDINGLHAAALGYVSAGRTTFTGVSVATLVSEGHMSTGFSATSKNPWGGVYTVAANTVTTKVDIALTLVPTNAGDDLERTFTTKAENVDYTGTTFTVTF